MNERPRTSTTGQGSEKAREAATRAQASTQLLARILDALADSTSTSDLLSRVAPAVVEALGDWCAIWLWDAAALRLRLFGLHHRQPEKAEPLRRLAEGWPSPRRGAVPGEISELAGVIAHTVEDERQATDILGSPELAHLAQRAGVSTLILAPLAHRNQALGLLAIGSDDPSAARDPQVVALAGEIARHTGAAIAQLQRVELVQQASQQLTLAGLRLQAVLENIPLGLIIADASTGRIESVNSALSRLLGRTVDRKAPVFRYPELLGVARPDGKPYRAEDIPWVQTARTGEPIAAEEMLIHRPDNRHATVLCSSSPIRDDAGRTVEVVAVLQDITERKEFERRKDEFLSIVSHELRTPMASIKGYSQMLERWVRKEPSMANKQAIISAAEAIDRQVERLGRLVADLLDFSKIQLGLIEISRARFSLGELAKEVVEHMQAAVPDRVLAPSVRGDTTVDADPSRIEQVLINLISNAVKATPEGGRVEVTVRREDKSVVAAVRDHGTGIPREAQKRIFERLFRGAERYEAGMGLGLFISKAIIDQHAGRIWFESEVGKGSTFSFELPAAE